jgi:Ni/Fe-hydrogenase subunit HybB-like protein
VPWDWRVSLYTWTKSVAAGVYLVALAVVLGGVASEAGALWRWAAPLLGGAFLAATALLLVADLEHPERFMMVLTRPQWRSWLVRGGFTLTFYGAFLFVHFLASLGFGGVATLRAIAAPTAALALLAAVYTAFLFAQATARDLWQSPLLAPHLAVQAALAGSAALLPVAAAFEPSAAPALGEIVAISAVVHLLFVLAEIAVPHPTAHARLAAAEMTAGRYRVFFWTGVALSVVATAAPWLGPPLAVPAALAGLFAHEHAYVQAGQAVPLA